MFDVVSIVAGVICTSAAASAVARASLAAATAAGTVGSVLAYFFFACGEPGRVFLVAHDVDLDRHEGVVAPHSSEHWP